MFTSIEAQIRNKISMLVSNYKKFHKSENCFYVDYGLDVNDCDKHELAALFIEWSGGDLCSIYENEDIAAHVIHLLKSDNKTSSIHFTDALKGYIAEYYEDKIIEMIDEELQEINSESSHAA